MIQPNELRIGNLIIGNVVYGGTARTFERLNNTLDVVFFSDGSIHEIGEFLKDCNPIPLTEEWLLKFGFKWNNQGAEYGGYEIEQCPGLLVYHNGGGWLHSGLGSPDSYGFPLDFQYVHELQNLVFSLKKIELIFNQ